jgi:hypothetical protein
LGTVLAAAGVVVAVAITVGLLALLGHQHGTPTGEPTGNPLPPAPPASFEPHLSPGERNHIDAARRAVVARDGACGASTRPELTFGSPSRALSSRFAVLRRPATPASALRTFLRNKPAYGPLATIGNFSQELYLNQIRLARTAFGARFYVIPAGNVTGQQGVPARCGREQVRALTRQIRHLPSYQRRRILAVQRQWLAYLRYLALHPEGICATFIPRHAKALDLADNFGCATMANFGQWGVLADGSAYLGSGVGVFWTVVPDGVATVILRFTEPDGRPLATSTVRPVNNVVVAKQPWKAPNRSGFPSTIVLRGANGGMIKYIRVTPDMITLCGYGC